MPFPISQRVIYRRNPLTEVICQLRFPPILKIETVIPYEFQDLIRDDYPHYNEKKEFQMKLPEGVSGQIPDELLDTITPGSSRKNYEFISEDENWKINLTRNFLALSTRRYTRWETFKQKFIRSFEALLEIYKPKNFTRIGLRYRDLIRRGALGLEDVAWSELLQPYILGILMDNSLRENVVNVLHNTEISLEDGESIVRIVSGLIEDADSGESGYLIDSDFFTTTKTDIDKAIDRLDYFNQRGSRLIQWAITEKLHQAMEPEPL
jgi:uncharacterized protein (TIGR04255 family)